MPAPSTFARRVAAIAEEQHRQFHLQHESDPQLSRQIQRYWEGIGLPFPGVATAWSAVFVSWCMKSAGATANEFKFSPAHAVFVNWAIKNATAQTGLFRGFELSTYAPNIGDIIQNNRGGTNFGFQFAKTHTQYQSHSAIVVETGQDGQGNYLLTVGGNESDSVGMKIVRLTATSFIKQRATNPYICVIQNLK
ncbi:MAG: DUF2272 domain-containing protein [Deltaproteobacteria bacterium]|nr:DUF2272 domain-containing protein [Deltaproteobacteria bacterium]